MRLPGPPIRAIATHPFRSVLRNRRATASALVGLVLGVAVVAAPWVALDSSVRGVLNYYLSELRVDAAGSGDVANLEEAADALRAVPNVGRVEPVALLPILFNRSESGLPSPESSYVIVSMVSPTFVSVAPRLGIVGLSVPPPGSIAVPESLLAQGLDVGDTVVLERRFPRYEANGTQVGEDAYIQNYTVSGHFGGTDTEWAYQDTMVLPLSEVSSVKGRLNLTDRDLAALEYIWLDRDALLDPFDPGGTVGRLTRQRILMANAVAPFGFFIEYAHASRGGTLIDIATSLESGSLSLRILFLAFAIPTLLAAWLLSKVGFDIGAPTRRRELAVLRARGLSGRGVRMLLLGECAVLAAVAAILGIVIAIVLSRFFFVPVAPGGVAFTPADVAVSGGTVLLSFLFAFLLAVAGSRGASRWLASEDLVASLRAYHAEEASVPHRASRDFLLAAIGAAGFLLLLAWGSLKDSPLSVVSFIVGVSTGVLAPMAPFFLAIALVRYLTRGTTAPYRALARLLRRWLGDFHDLVEKNLVRAPRRSSNATAIVTFVVGFVVAVTVLASSASAYRLEGVLRRTPSDVVAETYYGFGQASPFNASNQAAVRSIPGVAHVTVVVAASGSLGSAILFNTSTYLRTVPWVRADHVGGDPRSLMEQLARGDVFAADAYFEKSTGLQVGDVVNLGNILDVEARARLIAVIRGLPGLYWSFPGDEAYTSISYADIEALGPSLNLSRADLGRYLIALSPGADGRAVQDAISAHFRGSMSVRTLAEAKAMDAANALATATFSYLSVQADVAILLLGATVGLFVFSAFAERRDEFATMIARGAGARVVVRLLMAEGWVVSVLGILLGVFAGLLTVASFFALISAVAPTPVPFVVPIELAIPVLAIFAAVWVSSLLGALAIRRMDVARVLKLRGG